MIKIAFSSHDVHATNVKYIIIQNEYDMHQNLQHKKCRMIVEQYGTKIHYIQGLNTIVVDTLSKSKLTPSRQSKSIEIIKENLAKRILAKAFTLKSAKEQSSSPKNLSKVYWLKFLHPQEYI